MYRAHHHRQEQQVSSLAPAEAPSRVVTTFRLGKLVTGAGQSLCLVRAISDRTATLDIDVPFEADEAAVLEIGRETIAGTLVKLGGSRAELRCADPVELDTILASGGRRTLPRVEVDAYARIEVGGLCIAARIRDISTGGMKLFAEDVLCVGDRVRVTVKGLDARPGGTVRWCAGDHAGIEFAEPLPLVRLNAWLAGAALRDDRPIVSKS